MIKINEIFYSLQGEGFLAGIPSIFIRLSGCPLRCRWCDTKFAWDEDSGTEKLIEEIISEINNVQCNYVVITGGEPMINPHLLGLVSELHKQGKHITIETSGIAYTSDLKCDLVSISPKLSNSIPEDEKLKGIHEHSRLDLAILGEIIDNYVYQFKFVVE